MRCISLAVLLSGAMAGCGGPASIEVEPKTPLLTASGQTLKLTAQVKDKDGAVLANQPVKFTSLTPTMAQVSADGVIRAITSGQATVMVEAGKVSTQVRVLVQIAEKIQLETPPLPLMLGVRTGFKAQVIDDRGKPMLVGKMEWISSDSNIFTVDDLGNVKTINEGTAKLTVKAAGIEHSEEIVVKHEEMKKDGSLGQ